MAKRTIAVISIQAHPRHTKDTPDNRVDLKKALGKELTGFTQDAMTKISPERLEDSKNSRIYSILENIKKNDLLLIKAEAGFHGDTGQIIEADTRKTVANNKEGKLATMLDTRAAVVGITPTRGLLLVEMTRAGNVRQCVEGALRDQAKKQKLPITFTFMAVETGYEWLEKQAYLKELKVIRRRKTSDAADGEGEEKEIPGMFTYTASKFSKKSRYDILRKFTNPAAKVKPQDYIEYPELSPDEEEKIEIVATDGSRQVTFVLEDTGDYKTPALRELIPAKASSGIPTDEEFVKFCKEVAERY